MPSSILTDVSFATTPGMYKCPHCLAHSIPLSAIAFALRTECGVCHATLKTKVKWSNFLVAACMGVMSLVSLLTNVDIGVDTWPGMAILLAACVLQIGLIELAEMEPA